MSCSYYIEDEIISLFDYTNHPESGNRLQQLFNGSILKQGDATERQELLRSLLDSWNILGKFSYQKFDIKEVHAFTTCIEQYVDEYSSNIVGFLLDKDKHFLRSKYTQTIVVLNDLYDNFFKQLEEISLPSAFKSYIDQINGFIREVKIVEYAKEIADNKFSFRHASVFSKTLLASKLDNRISAFWDAFFEFEVLWSLAKGIFTQRFVFPEFSESGLLIENFYHPMISEPVKNTLQSENNIVVLTGPNMAGKSTMLKSIGLCVYLAHIGLAIPAARCRIPFYDCLLISINLTDDLRNGYSTFMKEVVNLKDIVTKAIAGKRCFAIFDEIFRGTNIDDAIEISRRTVIGLNQFLNCFFIISTHIYQLKEKLPEGILEPYQLQAMIDKGQLVHTYKLERGWSQLKFGSLIFEKEGLDKLFNSSLS